MPDYFTDKAFSLLNSILHGPEFYSSDDVDAVVGAMKEVARDQRHACAEAVNEAADDIAGHPDTVAHYHGAAMNAPLPASPQGGDTP